MKKSKLVLLYIVYGLFHPDGIEPLKLKEVKRKKRTIYFIYKLYGSRYLIFYKESKTTEIITLYKTYSASTGLFFQGVVKNVLTNVENGVENANIFVHKDKYVGSKCIPIIYERMIKSGWSLLK